MKKSLLLLFLLPFSILAQKPLIPYWKGEKVGLSTPDFKIVLKPAYDRIMAGPAGTYYVWKGQKMGVVNNKGQFVVKPLYKSIEQLRYDILPPLHKNGFYYRVFDEQDQARTLDSTGNLLLDGELVWLDANHTVVRNSVTSWVYKNGQLLFSGYTDVRLAINSRDEVFFTGYKDQKNLFIINAQGQQVYETEMSSYTFLPVQPGSTKYRFIFLSSANEQTIYDLVAQKRLPLDDLLSCSLAKEGWLIIGTSEGTCLYDITRNKKSAYFQEIYPFKGDEALVLFNDSLQVYNLTTEALGRWKKQGSAYSVNDAFALIKISDSLSAYFLFGPNGIKEISLWEPEIIQYLQEHASDSAQQATIANQVRRNEPLGYVLQPESSVWEEGIACFHLLNAGTDFFTLLDKTGNKFSMTDANLIQGFKELPYIYYKKNELFHLCDFSGKDLYTFQYSDYLYEPVLPPALSLWLSRSDTSWRQVPVYFSKSLDNFQPGSPFIIHDPANKRWGLIQDKNKWVTLSYGIDTMYYLDSEENDLVVKKNNACNILDPLTLKTRYTIPNCDMVESSLNEGCFLFKTNNLYGICNAAGKVVLEPVNDEIILFQPVMGWDASIPYLNQKDFAGFYSFKQNNRYGLFHLKSGKIIPAQYDELVDAGNKVIGFTQNGQRGLMDTLGRVLAPAVYTSIDYPAKTGDPFVCHKAGKQFADEYTAKGEKIPESQLLLKRGKGPYYPFEISTNNGSRYGYKNVSGEVVFPPLLLDAGPFANGYSLIEKANGINSRSLLVNTRFEQALPADSVNVYRALNAFYTTTLVSENNQSYRMTTLLDSNLRTLYKKPGLGAYAAFNKNQAMLVRYDVPALNDSRYALINQAGQELVTDAEYYSTPKDLVGLYMGNNQWRYFVPSLNLISPKGYFVPGDKWMRDEQSSPYLLLMEDSAANKVAWIPLTNQLIETGKSSMRILSDKGNPVYAIDSWKREGEEEVQEVKIIDAKGKILAEMKGKRAFAGTFSLDENTTGFTITVVDKTYYFNREGRMYGKL